MMVLMNYSMKKYLFNMKHMWESIQ